ncbi:carbamoyl-phosphate synthase large subunit [Herpetosiphon geysericola]|uniref:Carbamoyl phosphate synthase large chain n=1 Tax=Herpetosiphon geysericola TaxID=70996 RepID=A0A0N8GPN6_9CHLR|nr:carbamoyl-phosphate synthase large subunit [Herpetosiphon geysericola]KPL81402.1 carbamoyl phosphate synthase large subunit [Herpetosiphon geysericola]
MPKRSDIHSILVLGAGPIVIGQACEFDYSGTQAIKALREEGYRIILVNSNPATIMTDPSLADRTYIEPLDVPTVSEIIARERPDALLPTVGGQTALNLAMDLHRAGVLEQYNVQLLGANVDAIATAEDRELFKQAMDRIGLQSARSGIARSLEEALELVKATGFPSIIRPSFTLGGAGGGIAYNSEDFRRIVEEGLKLSPIGELLIEESLLGWKEYELELMRDSAGNGVVVCSIENFDPMGVHTGDSITVAPAMTLSDREYQRLRDMGLAVMEVVGVATGGSNVQFAINPHDGRVIVIEMNPRVSRSSALASKATGFPIAKIAAKLAVGYTLPELPNDITKSTPASFEPALDYVVVKIPRWNFEKFPGSQPVLGTAMKSVGEAMAMGRTFTEALQKALRSLENGRMGWGADGSQPVPQERLRELLITPTPQRIFAMRTAFDLGWTVDQIHELTKIDYWFLDQLASLIALEKELRQYDLATIPAELLLQAKRNGYSDPQLAYLLNANAAEVRQQRLGHGITPTYHHVDTCAAEFPAQTPYLYSSYETESEANPSDRRKVMILGGGPNRIGQGLEFDYCCCHAVFALRELGYETIMVNCNPETVSTDYDTADRLYFEPLTLEDVLNIVDVEQPAGVLLQFGGQTPLKLAKGLEAAGVPLWGTSPAAIDRAEDRGQFGAVLAECGLRATPYGSATSWDEARAIAERIGYPTMVRPSYVLGGQGMAIIHDQAGLDDYLRHITEASPEHPVLLDRFLEDATELDVDAVADGETVVIAGMMEQIERAGIHSGDSACVMPTVGIKPEVVEQLKLATDKLARALGVVGLMNVQFAVKDDEIYVLEVNPRASRSIPYVAKASGVAWAALAAKVMAGVTLKQQGISSAPALRGFHVKEVVLPWRRFPGATIALGPEMRSTGEAMGSGDSFGAAFAKAQAGCGRSLPTSGAIFVSVNDHDKPALVPVAKQYSELGFNVIATAGTAQYLREQGLKVESIYKVNEGRPNAADYIINGQVDIIVNTPLGRASLFDEQAIRQTALRQGVISITTVASAAAVADAIQALREGGLGVRALQD